MVVGFEFGEILFEILVDGKNKRQKNQFNRGGSKDECVTFVFHPAGFKIATSET